MKKSNLFLISVFFISFTFLVSCKSTAQLSQKTTQTFLLDTAIQGALMGISIFEPATNKYHFKHNAEKYFTPASNTKLFSMYAGLTYLGDKLKGLRYRQTDTALFIYPTADPSFLWSEYDRQPVYDFLKNKENIIVVSPGFIDYLAYGWSWEDYKDYFMAQRSEFPIYGNIVTINKKNNQVKVSPPTYPFSVVEENNKAHNPAFKLQRTWGYDSVSIFVNKDNNKDEEQVITFEPNLKNFIKYLSDTLKKPIKIQQQINSPSLKNNDPALSVIYSQPTDSLLKPMMHRSDNFFAEQTLLMASNEVLGYMNYDSIINYMLTHELKDMPQKPQWVDGSGLSRYDLFSPDDFVFLLNKLKDEFGMIRLKNILATGGEGTLKYYYRKDAGYIFAKTGTLNNNCALSGYLITKKNKLYIFSILANNYVGGATPIRRAVEKFLTEIKDKN